MNPSVSLRSTAPLEGKPSTFPKSAKYVILSAAKDLCKRAAAQKQKAPQNDRFFVGRGPPQNDTVCRFLKVASCVILRNEVTKDL